MPRASIARYNRNLGRYVKKVIDSQNEKKVYDNTQAYTMTNEGFVTPLCKLANIQEGDQLINRLGQNIDLRKIIVQGYVSIPPAGGEEDYPNYQCRVIIFQWLSDPYSDPPLVSDIIQSYYQNAPSGPMLTSTTLLSSYNKTNAGKYHVMYDHMFTMSFYGESIRHFYCKLTNFREKRIPYSVYEESGGVGTKNYYPNTGDIYILTIQNVPEESYEPIQISFSTRTIFTDD